MRINTNQIQDFLQKPPPIQQPSAKNVPKDPDASLQVDYASLVDQAVQTTQTDAQAVRQAEELLLSGQLLENPENIREAAENIVKFGI